MEDQQMVFPKEFSELNGVRETAWSEQYRTDFHVQIPFLYEAAIISGLEALKPWENPEQYVPQVIHEWEQLKNQLHERHSNRKLDGVQEMMKRGIAFFYEAIFWCNEMPVPINKEPLTNLTLQPINTVERLSFIITRPVNYHSYIQLSELFIELKKVFSKEQVMKKASKR